MSMTFRVKLNEATQRRLKVVAKGLDRAPHWVIKTALSDYLDREEAVLRERKEDVARWERFQESGQVIEQERIMVWLDALAAGRKELCQKKSGY